jgi:hypothetical protein
MSTQYSVFFANSEAEDLYREEISNNSNFSESSSYSEHTGPIPNSLFNIDNSTSIKENPSIKENLTIKENKNLSIVNKLAKKISGIFKNK